MTVNTFKGLIRSRRLPHGTSSTGSLIQSVMDKILIGIDNVDAYLDYTLSSSKAQEDMLFIVHKVFSRLNEYGVNMEYGERDVRRRKRFQSEQVWYSKIQPDLQDFWQVFFERSKEVWPLASYWI